MKTLIITDTLMGNVDNERSHVYEGARSIWEISVPSLQFGCELKAALKP